MRLLRIDQVGDMRAPILLHEQLSVVTGLRGATRARLLAGLAGLPRGRPDGLTGEIEAQGVRFDLTPEALGMLDLPATTDIVVRATDLPGAQPEDDRAGARRLQLELEREQLVARLDEARKAAEEAEQERAVVTERLAEARAAHGEAEARSASAAEREAARQRLDEAARALDEAAAAVAAAHEHHRSLLEHDTGHLSADELEARHADLRRQGEEASAAVDEAQARLDPGAADALATAETAHAEAEAALVAFDDEVADALDADDLDGPEPDHGPDHGPDPALLARRDDLRRELDELAAQDPSALEDALGRVVLPEAPAVDDGTADRLAREWADLHDQVEALDGGAVNGSARAARTSPARRPTAKPPVTVNSGPMSPADIDAIEAAHTAVLEAQERSEARFGGGKKAKRRLTEARDAEQEVLDAFGFETYAEFMMSSSRADEGPADDGELDDDDLLVRPVADLDPRAELHARLDDLRAEITTLLGHEPADDPTAQLRAYPVAVDETEALDDLRSELVRVGMALDDAQFQPDTLVALARVWLGEQQQVDDHRDALAAELAEVEASLGAADARGDAPAEGAVGGSDQDAAADAATAARRSELVERLDAAAAAVERAAARLEAAQAALADLDRHEEAFFEAQSAEDAVVAELAAERQGAADRAAAHEAEVTAAAEAVARAEAAHDASLAAHAEAHEALAAFPDDDADAGPVVDVEALEAELGSLTEQVASASATIRMVEVEVEAIDRRLAESEAVEQREAEQQRPSERVTEELLEEIEWELLRRLSDHRQVSIAGSLPLVLDDPFRHLSGDDAVRLLNGLERMASAVQLLVLTDDPTVVGWAEELGESRATVVGAG